MGTVKINASHSYTAPIYIGREEENKVTAVQFDLSDWIDLYGSGSATLRIKRRDDRNPYPVPLVITDGIATWIISSTDTQIRGHGEAQLTYYVDDKIKKSIIYGFYVTQSLPAEGSAPDPYESWITTLEQLSADTLISVQEAQTAERNAKASEQSASQSASDAEQSSQEAQGYADDASASAQSANTDAGRAEAAKDTAQTYANNAQTSATSAYTSASQASASAGTASAAATSASASAASAYADAERAEQAAATSGYLWFYIEDGKLYMDRTANTQVDFFMRDGKLYVEERA